MIVAELFSQGPRAAAVNIGVLVNWFANGVIGLTFPFLEVSSHSVSRLPTYHRRGDRHVRANMLTHQAYLVHTC